MSIRARGNVNIEITNLDLPSTSALPLEIVERKGAGHPDTICDALAEHLSVTMSRYYLERFGMILHHNVDKALLCGGVSRPAFGGGKLIVPIEIYLAGRATIRFHGVDVPLDEIAIEAVRNWLRGHLPSIDAIGGVRVYPKFRPTSPDLAALFARQHQAGIALANDTSIGVGFAPLDDLEATVLGVEGDLHLPATKRAHPEIGDDIKIMGVRSGLDIDLTIACAFIDRHVVDVADYQQKKARITDLATRCAHARTRQPVTVAVNTADGDTADSLYLTVTGLSAESGDDGQVGRGNRLNGLITPYRPMSLEAAAGKNPVSHVGKLYNVLATRIARALVKQVPDMEEAYCYLVSQIGRPIREPLRVDVKARLHESASLHKRRTQVVAIVEEQLSTCDALWRELIGVQVGASEPQSRPST